MGRLYEFNASRPLKQRTESEQRLSQLFYTNARTDVEYLLRLYLYKCYGQDVHPDFFADELKNFRETQGYMPSTAEVSLRMSFDIAISGGMKTVQTAMRQQKLEWAKSAVHYNDDDYLDGVVASVVNDDTVLINHMIEKLMKQPKSLKSAMLQVRKAGSPDPVITKLTIGLQKRVGITGAKLREKVEAMAGCKIARECKDGKIVPLTYGTVLPFKARTV